MHDDSLLPIRLVFGLLFFAALVGGLLLFKNYEKLFGVDQGMPSENGSSRAYTKIQVFALWVHVLALTAAFALLLH